MKSSEKIVVTSSGMSLSSLLFVLFLALKLTGVIAWSWWWVFAPLWAPLAICLAVLTVVLVIMGVIALVS